MKLLVDRKDKLPEEQLVNAVVRFLSNNGYRIRTEVPNMGQSADVVATRGRWITFIEVKRKDWRRALVQCRAHEQVADFVCVAIGTKSVSPLLQQEIKFAGYGLIHCVGQTECEWILTPTRNAGVWAPQRRKLSEILRTIDHVN